MSSYKQSVLLLLLLPVTQAWAQSARTELVFPAVASTRPAQPVCSWWEARFSFFNPNATPVTVTLTGFDSNGSVKESASRTINGFNFGSTDGEMQFGFKESFVGWVKVTATQPLIVFESIAQRVVCPDPTAEFQSCCFLRSRLRLAPAVGTRRKFVEIAFDNTILGNTGISIVFPSKVSNSFANGKLVFRHIDGRRVAEKDVTIPANGQIVRFFTEFLPEALNFSQGRSAVGSLELTFDQEVFITAIQFEPSTAAFPEEWTEPLSVIF